MFIKYGKLPLAACSVPAAAECKSVGDVHNSINDHIAYDSLWSRRATARPTEKELHGDLDPQAHLRVYARTGGRDDTCAGHSCLCRQDGRRAPAAAARRLPHRVQPHPLQPSHRHVQVCTFDLSLTGSLTTLTLQNFKEYLRELLLALKQHVRAYRRRGERVLVAAPLPPRRRVHEPTSDPSTTHSILAFHATNPLSLRVIVRTPVRQAALPLPRTVHLYW